MSSRSKRIMLNITSSILTVLIMFVSFFALVNIIFNFVYIRTNVRGFSMYPTLNANVPNENFDGDVVYINKFSGYTNSDIVVADVGWWNRGYIIKRLIGCPNDIVQIKDEGSQYALYVNDKILYTKEKNLDTNYYYNSIYLTFFEKFPENTIRNEMGEQCIILNENEYLLMGDNWGNSTDCLTGGPTEENDIIGRVDIIIHYGENQFRTLVNKMWNLIF